jgi:hypothetical protein
MIVEDERHDGRNEHIWDFQGELVAPSPGTPSQQYYLHINVEVTEDNMCKCLPKDLVEYQRVLAGHEVVNNITLLSCRH